MNHEELVEKCQAAAHEVVKGNYLIDAKMKITTREMAAAIISNIFTALHEPTEEMLDEARWYCDVPINTWQSMLSSSPLKPKE